MKINWGKLLRVAGRLVMAAPAMVEAARPVLAKHKKRKGHGRDEPPGPQPAPAGRSGEVGR